MTSGIFELPTMPHVIPATNPGFGDQGRGKILTSNRVPRMDGMQTGRGDFPLASRGCFDGLLIRSLDSVTKKLRVPSTVDPYFPYTHIIVV